MNEWTNAAFSASIRSYSCALYMYVALPMQFGYHFQVWRRLRRSRLSPESLPRLGRWWRHAPELGAARWRSARRPAAARQRATNVSAAAHDGLPQPLRRRLRRKLHHQQRAGHWLVGKLSRARMRGYQHSTLWRGSCTYGGNVGELYFRISVHIYWYEYGTFFYSLLGSFVYKKKSDIVTM